MLTAPSTKAVTTYIGQIWYDHLGNLMEETGNPLPEEAARRIAAIDKQLTGKWSFSVVTIKTFEGGVERWISSVVFPDGKTRKLLQGEVAISQQSKGKWIGYAELTKIRNDAKLKTDIRAAPDTRFPWKTSAVQTARGVFKNVLEIERWLTEHTKDETIVFIFTPGLHVLPPDDEMLYCYLAIAPR